MDVQIRKTITVEPSRRYSLRLILRSNECKMTDNGYLQKVVWLMFAILECCWGLSIRGSRTGRRLITKMNERIDGEYRTEFAQSIITTFFPKGALPTDTDRQVIEERHVGRSVPGLFAVSSVRCRFGFSQAYVSYPVNSNNGISSGMVRLSCPHLVKEIDRIEKEGAITELDATLASSSSSSTTSLRSNFEEINADWKAIRNAAVTQKDRDVIVQMLGPEGSNNLMNSGIIGCTNTLQSKCLHAHTADYLLRGVNKLGEATLHTLSEQGVDRNGCNDCWQQCDLKHKPVESSWWYIPKKNKQRLTTARLTRQLLKAKRNAKSNTASEEEAENNPTYKSI